VQDATDSVEEDGMQKKLFYKIITLYEIATKKVLSGEIDILFDDISNSG